MPGPASTPRPGSSSAATALSTTRPATTSAAGRPSRSRTAPTRTSRAAGATGVPGLQEIVSSNNASLSVNYDFTITPDTAAPTGQTVALSGGPWYTTTSVPLVLDNGTDADSGVDPASGVIERQSATLT